MFLSGFCICLSLKRNYDLKRFYTNRFKRIILSYIIIAVPFFLWKSIEEFSSMRVAHFFFDISGLSFWIRGCLNAWFVQAIIMFYIITPLLFLAIRQNIFYAITLLLMIYVGIIIGYYFVPRFNHSAIAWSRLPIFLIGIIWANYTPNTDIMNHRLWAIASGSIGALLLLIIPPYLSIMPALYSWLLFGLFVIPILLVYEQLVLMMPERVRKLFSSLGKVSLEIYICHVMILHVVKFYKFETIFAYSMYFILPIVSIPLSYITLMISKRLTNIKIK